MMPYLAYLASAIQRFAEITQQGKTIINEK